MGVTTRTASPNAPIQPTRKEQLAPHIKTTLKGHTKRVCDVAFIHGTRLLVTGSEDKSIRVWDLDTGKQVGEPLLDHDAEVWRIAASPDGQWIVSGAGNGSILVWEVAPNKRELKRVPISFKGHGGGVMSVVFAPDSKTFASASTSSWDKTVRVWKRETGEIVHGPLEVGSCANSVSYSADGKKLAAGTDEHIIVWNTKTGKELLKIEQRAWQVAFTPDGLRLVSGSLKNIRISNAITGDIIKQFDAHTTNSIHALAIAPNGTKFAITSYDKTTRFFDLITFEPIGEPLEHPDKVYGVAFSKDSQLVATGCLDKLVRTWTVPLSKSELQQSTEEILKPRPRRAPIQTNRFFDGFDPHASHGRNTRAVTTTRDTDGFKNTMNRLFSRSSAPQNHTPRSRSIPLVDVFPVRAKPRTANRHTAERDKKLQQQRPPRNWQPQAGTSSSNTPPAGTSNVVGGATPATLHTGSGDRSATTTHPSPLGIEHVPDISCFAFLTRCFPRPARTRPTSPSAPRSS